MHRRFAATCADAISARALSVALGAKSRARDCAFPQARVVALIRDRDVAGLVRDAREPGAHPWERRQVEAALGRDVCVRIQGDVGDGARITDEEAARAQVLL